MSEASKAAEEYVVVKKDQIPGEDHLWNDLGLARAHIAGAKALLEWAKAQVPQPDTEDEWFIEMLESYFAEEKK